MINRRIKIKKVIIIIRTIIVILIIKGSRTILVEIIMRVGMEVFKMNR